MEKLDDHYFLSARPSENSNDHIHTRTQRHRDSDTHKTDSILPLIYVHVLSTVAASEVSNLNWPCSHIPNQNQSLRQMSCMYPEQKRRIATHSYGELTLDQVRAR